MNIINHQLVRLDLFVYIKGYLSLQAFTTSYSTLQLCLTACPFKFSSVCKGQIVRSLGHVKRRNQICGKSIILLSFDLILVQVHVVVFVAWIVLFEHFCGALSWSEASVNDDFDPFER